MAKALNRKITRIVEKTYREFMKAVAHEGGLTQVDEIVSVGYSLLMNTTVIPLEILSPDKPAMRRELAAQFAMLIEKGTEEGN